jgi:hypothetical protein
VLASSSGANIWRYTAYIKTKGFEITSSALEGLLSSNQSPAAGQYDFDEMIFSSSYASDAGGLAAVGGGGTVTLNYTNCLIVTTGVRNIDCRTASQTVNIDHCGFIGAHDNGIALLIDTATVTNSWAFGQTGGGEDWWTGGAAPTGSHNASSDTSVDTDYTSSLDSLDESNELTNSSTTLSAFDGTLQSGSNLIGAGTGSESVDITGAARTGAVDIGPFNYTSAGDVVIEVPLGPLR